MCFVPNAKRPHSVRQFSLSRPKLAPSHSPTGRIGVPNMASPSSKFRGPGFGDGQARRSYFSFGQSVLEPSAHSMKLAGILLKAPMVG